MGSIDPKDTEAIFILVVVTGVTLALNTGTAFCVGVLCSVVFWVRIKASDLFRAYREKRKRRQDNEEGPAST